MQGGDAELAEIGDQVGVGEQHTADHDAHRSALLLVVEYGVELRRLKRTILD